MFIHLFLKMYGLARKSLLKCERNKKQCNLQKQARANLRDEYGRPSVREYGG